MCFGEGMPLSTVPLSKPRPEVPAPLSSSLLSSQEWHGFSLDGIVLGIRAAQKDAFPGTVPNLPPYYWYDRNNDALVIYGVPNQSFPVHSGYHEARSLIGEGSVFDLRTLSNEARKCVRMIFASSATACRADSSRQPSFRNPQPALVELRLSADLQDWKTAQHAQGHVLPKKGYGLKLASERTLRLLGAKNWPTALKTNNALFGCGIASLLMGAADAPTLFSNYVTDMAFYYEHGYNHVFPSLEALLWDGIADTDALRTPGGRERRDAVLLGKEYIQDKIALEKQHKARLTNLSARVDRRTAQIIFLSESSLLGMAAEAIARGFDPGAVMSDLVFSSPGTDVVDIGCDLINSEVMNSFLNTADITESGIVTEAALCKVYDAYAAVGARMLTQRWYEPVARMCAALYTWHIQNDRHMFFRRALLGWPKTRKIPTHPQREVDFDEAFDCLYHTTGYWRPLSSQYACDANDTCNHVNNLFQKNSEETLLPKLWSLLVLSPLEYVKAGFVDEEFEQNIAEDSRICMAELYSKGLVLEMVWIIAHANFHAWQVNHLFEAAMFGSILDGGKLVGKLDRQEEL